MKNRYSIPLIVFLMVPAMTSHAGSSGYSNLGAQSNSDVQFQQSCNSGSVINLAGVSGDIESNEFCGSIVGALDIALGFSTTRQRYQYDPTTGLPTQIINADGSPPVPPLQAMFDNIQSMNMAQITANNGAISTSVNSFTSSVDNGYDRINTQNDTYIGQQFGTLDGNINTANGNLQQDLKNMTTGTGTLGSQVDAIEDAVHNNGLGSTIDLAGINMEVGGVNFVGGNNATTGGTTGVGPNPYSGQTRLGAGDKSPVNCNSNEIAMTALDSTHAAVRTCINRP
ncbi:MAG: hypothetical protein ACXWP5_02000 [Bdellovibrionota bacterium]